MSSDIVHLIVHDGGFELVVHAELPVVNKVEWSDIKKVEVFRSDEDGVISIRLKISLYWGRHRILIENSLLGFDQLTEAMEAAYPCFSTGWKERIWAPFGYPHHETIYEAD